MKQHKILLATRSKKEASTVLAMIRTAVFEERERCAKIADDYKERALQDGMLMPAAVGKIIAEAIRTS